MSEDAPPADPATPPGPGSRLGALVLILTLAIDQATKWIAEAALDLDAPIDVFPFLALHLTYNPGIAFSFLTGSNSDLLLGAVILVTGIVLLLWVRAKEGGRLATVGFGLIVGGAVGNIVDRFVHGHVVDFLRLHFGDWDLFVFNLADLALTIGPLILIVAFLWGPRPKARTD